LTHISIRRFRGRRSSDVACIYGSIVRLSNLNNVRRVAKNALALSFTSTARILLGVALQVYLARALGAAGLGKYAIILAFINIFQIVSELGLPALVIREAARRRQEASAFLYATALAQLAGAGAAWALLALSAVALRYPADTTRLILLSGAALVPYAWSSACETLFQAQERMEFIPLVELLGNGCQLGLAVWLISAGYGVNALPAIIVIPQVVVAFFSLGVAGALGWLTPARLDLAFSWRLVRAAPDFFLLALSVVIFSRLDILVVSKLLGEQATGIYNAAYQVVRVVNLGAASYSDAIYPAFSRLYREAPERFAAIGRRALQYGLMAVLPIATGTTILAAPLIAAIFRRAQYAEAVPILQILSWLCVPFLVSAILSRLLLAGNQQRISLQISLIKLAAAGFYLLLMTPLWGLKGAALASVAGTFTGALLNWLFVTRRLAALGVRDLAAKPVLAAFGMGAIVFFLPDRLELGFSVALGAIIYGVLLLLMRAFTGEDWLLLQQLTFSRVGPSRQPNHLTGPQQGMSDGGRP
jgi:O-antigen/teichoic acid export membrane protein